MRRDNCDLLTNSQISLGPTLHYTTLHSMFTELYELNLQFILTLLRAVSMLCTVRIIIVISGFLYCAHIRHSVTLKVLPEWWDYVWTTRLTPWHHWFSRCCGAICCQSSQDDKCTGFFMCVTRHTGPTALRPIPRTKHGWLTVLLKDTAVSTWTRTHTLLIRNTRVEFVATTLPVIKTRLCTQCGRDQSFHFYDLK